MNVKMNLPLLPLRDIVVFPNMVIPLFVGREKSIKALQEAMKTDKSIILVAQKNSETDEPSEKDLFSFGCLSKVLKLLKLPDKEDVLKVTIDKSSAKGDSDPIITYGKKQSTSVA